MLSTQNPISTLKYQHITKTIVCYGDSNTWGKIAENDQRYPKDVRWPGVLQQLLGSDFEVISEGLNGRTFVAIDPAKPHRCGITHLQAILETNDPIDLIIIMLGTNDVKNAYNLSGEDIASHLEQTIQLIRSDKVDIEQDPKILVICPPPVIHPIGSDLDPRMINGPDIFKQLPELYKEVAEKYDCAFINAGKYISSGTVDGYHLEADAHIKLAGVIKEAITVIL